MGAEGDPHLPLGSERVLAQDLHEGGEGFVQPDTLPPLHGDEVTKPHVSEFVQHHVGDALHLGERRRRRVDQEVGHPVRDATEVLHRALHEVGDGDHVHLVPGIGDIEVVGEETEPERAGLEGVRGEVRVADRIDDSQRYAVDVQRLGLFERSDDEGHEVRRHLHRRREAHRALTVAEVGIRRNRRVGVGAQVTRHREVHLVRRLEGRLVPTGEGPTGVGVLELGGGDGVLDARRVGERRTVETVQLVVQDAVEGDLEDGRAYGQPGIKGVGGDFVLLVEAQVDRAMGRAAGGERRGAEVELNGVQLQCGRRLHDVDVDFDATGERGALQIRGDEDPIGRRDYRSVETIGVGFSGHMQPP